MDIVIANGKGGCGKTTLSAHLAAALAASTQTEVALVDHDPQRSASDWFRSRQQAKFHKSLLPVSLFAPQDQQQHAMPIRVHDLAAGFMPLTSSEIDLSRAALLIPVLPCAVDIKALFRYTMKLNRVGAFEGYAQVALIANRVKPKCESSELLERFMDAQELASAASISNSEVYVRAMSTGITCFDHPLKANEKQRAHWLPLIKMTEACAYQSESVA